MAKYRLRNGRLQRSLAVTQLEDRVTPTLCCGDFLTYTQGGWGAEPNGDNPGTYLHGNFAGAFTGGVQIGSQTLGAASDGNTTPGNQAALFTTAQAITDWLPHGGKSGSLGGDTVNPLLPAAPDDGTLAGQTLALTLNLGFDDYDPAFSPSGTDMGNLIVTTGPFAGKTAQFVLDTCNAILSGITTTGYTADEANAAATAINENFDNGSANAPNYTDNGFLDCNEDDCDNGQRSIVTLAGLKFEDHNGNGVQDGTDQGLAGWHVTVWLDSNGDGMQVTGETHDLVTGADGKWTYSEPVLNSVLADDGIVSGDGAAGADWTASEVNQVGWTQTYGNAGYSGTFTAEDTEQGLDFGNFKNIDISGVKFYDANANGDWDMPGEPAINGWTFGIDFNNDGDFADAGETQTTALNGTFNFTNLGPGTYTVYELNGLTGTWVPTTSTAAGPFTASSGVNVTGLEFGNVKLGAGGGLTLGFWSNKNGKATMDAGPGGMAGALAMLSGLNLRNANGSHFDPTTYAQFRTWLLGATATNMSYMLSAQLAAMELNVFESKVVGTSLIYAPGTTSANGAGFATVNAVMAEANAALLANGLVLDGSPDRSYQEALKNALDKANNNLNFLIGLVAWHDDVVANGVIDEGEI